MIRHLEPCGQALKHRHAQSNPQQNVRTAEQSHRPDPPNPESHDTGLWKANTLSLYTCDTLSPQGVAAMASKLVGLCTGSGVTRVTLYRRAQTAKQRRWETRGGRENTYHASANTWLPTRNRVKHPSGYVSGRRRTKSEGITLSYSQSALHKAASHRSWLKETLCQYEAGQDTGTELFLKQWHGRAVKTSTQSIILSL